MKARPIEPQHVMFTVCESNSVCVEKMFSSLLETFTRQIQNEDCNTVKSERV